MPAIGHRHLAVAHQVQGFRRPVEADQAEILAGLQVLRLGRLDGAQCEGVIGSPDAGRGKVVFAGPGQEVGGEVAPFRRLPIGVELAVEHDVIQGREGGVEARRALDRGGRGGIAQQRQNMIFAVGAPAGGFAHAGGKRFGHALPGRVIVGDQAADPVPVGLPGFAHFGRIRAMEAVEQHEGLDAPCVGFLQQARAGLEFVDQDQDIRRLGAGNDGATQPADRLRIALGIENLELEAELAGRRLHRGAHRRPEELVMLAGIEEGDADGRLIGVRPGHGGAGEEQGQGERQHPAAMPPLHRPDHGSLSTPKFVSS